MIDKVRELALKVLYDIDINGAYSNIALDKAFSLVRKNENTQENFEARDFGFVSEIVYGTVSWRLTIDAIIKKYSSLKLKKISPWILNILRMSIFQILFLDKVPKSAAVNEGVNLAKRYGHKASSNFVNAVLRNVDIKDYEAFFDIKDDVERISKTTSMPLWLVEMLLRQTNYNYKKVEQICKASNLKPNLSIRVNCLKTDVDDFKNQLQNLSNDVVETGTKIKFKNGIINNFLIVDGVKNIEKLKLFQDGLFTVQDEAAGLIPNILNPKPNDKVLDACSSPGGKTTYIAELMENKGEIEAWDLHKHRVKLVEQTANRLGISIIRTKIQDATQYKKEYEEYFDKILLDVPCLGIGVLKRKPDIKWQRKPEDIKNITKLQKQILDNCSKYLKKGGNLVYSTCSILKEENEDVIQDFLQKHKNFSIKKIDKEINNIIEDSFLKKFVEKRDFIQLYQNEKTDGFFICKLQKN